VLVTVSVLLDGERRAVPAGWTVAAALFAAGCLRFRTSTHGEPRAPLCGMGVCFECRVTIDGVPHRRACLEICCDGMEIETGG
jgi:sarcosine oxidase subunit alpha